MREPKSKKRKRATETPESTGISSADLARIRSARHQHTHEIHGFSQVERLRRRYRVALGYPAREP